MALSRKQLVVVVVGAAAVVVVVRSGKTDPVQLKGRLNRALVAYKNGRFASSLLLLGIGLS